MKKVLLGLCLFTTASTGYPQMEIDVTTGNGLYELCSNPGLVSQARCMSFIQGAVGGNNAQANFRGETPLYCIPSGVTVGQTEAILMKYLNQNPEYRQLQSGFLLYGALFQAFPCPKATKMPS